MYGPRITDAEISTHMQAALRRTEAAVGEHRQAICKVAKALTRSRRR
jgi:hypothetical protein